MSLKMFKLFLFSFTFCIFASGIYAASISFIQPGNGSTVTQYQGVDASQTYVPVPVNIGYSGQGFNHFIKFFAGSQTWNTKNGDIIPTHINSTPGSYSWRAELWYHDELGQEQFQCSTWVNFNVRFVVTTTLNFSGTLTVDGNNVSSGATVNKMIGDNVSLGAIDQTNGNYNMTWNQSGTNNSVWGKIRYGEIVYSNIGASRNTSYTVASNDNGATIQGNMKKICNISYITQAGGAAQTWQVTVNGSSYTSPTNNTVVEQNAITASVPQVQDPGGNVWYWFDRWEDNSTSTSRTTYPSQHQNYTAIYKTVPVFHEGRYRNLVITGTVRPGVGNIKLMWSEHPNTSVTQYQVWRRIKYINGVPQPLTPVLIATVNRGTTQYVDNNFTYTPTDLSTVLEYDVKAYYAPEGTTSQDDWESVSAYDARVNKSSVEPEITKITEYKVMNYPNPFNPTTTINYQLPEPGFVTLKVYDVLGKEVAVLVNEYKDQGNYNAEFEGSSLSSGLYFYELRSNNFVSVKKMMLLR